MPLYYKAFGLVADVALTLNLVILVSVMSLLGATLTLPGIAGIVLTVGMAVDANVLVLLPHPRGTHAKSSHSRRSRPVTIAPLSLFSTPTRRHCSWR